MLHRYDVIATGCDVAYLPLANSLPVLVRYMVPSMPHLTILTSSSIFVLGVCTAILVGVHLLELVRGNEWRPHDCLCIT